MEKRKPTATSRRERRSWEFLGLKKKNYMLTFLSVFTRDESSDWKCNVKNCGQPWNNVTACLTANRPYLILN